mmetsp:Transcript_43043/g.100449  ORF Transcript_43043/g.100449 Transcript_43043/m.100449 type:complete len:359 (-) Transcript_43043:1433-2509(-)
MDNLDLSFGLFRRLRAGKSRWRRSNLLSCNMCLSVLVELVEAQGPGNALQRRMDPIDRGTKVERQPETGGARAVVQTLELHTLRHLRCFRCCAARPEYLREFALAGDGHSACDEVVVLSWQEVGEGQPRFRHHHRSVHGFLAVELRKIVVAEWHVFLCVILDGIAIKLVHVHRCIHQEACELAPSNHPLVGSSDHIVAHELHAVGFGWVPGNRHFPAGGRMGLFPQVRQLSRLRVLGAELGDLRPSTAADAVACPVREEVGRAISQAVHAEGIAALVLVCQPLEIRALYLGVALEVFRVDENPFLLDGIWSQCQPQLVLLNLCAVLNRWLPFHFDELQGRQLRTERRWLIGHICGHAH